SRRSGSGVGGSGLVSGVRLRRFVVIRARSGGSEGGSRRGGRRCGDRSDRGRVLVGGLVFGLGRGGLGRRVRGRRRRTARGLHSRRSEALRTPSPTANHARQTTTQPNHTVDGLSAVSLGVASLGVGILIGELSGVGRVLDHVGSLSISHGL